MGRGVGNVGQLPRQNFWGGRREGPRRGREKDRKRGKLILLYYLGLFYNPFMSFYLESPRLLPGAARGSLPGRFGEASHH